MKFRNPSRRSSTRRTEQLLLMFLEKARFVVDHLVIDSTSFGLTSVNRHYVRPLNRRGEKPSIIARGAVVNHYLNHAIVARTRKQTIVVVKFTRDPANCSLDFMLAMKEIRPAENHKKIAAADEGHNAESNCGYAIECTVCSDGDIHPHRLESDNQDE